MTPEHAIQDGQVISCGGTTLRRRWQDHLWGRRASFTRPHRLSGTSPFLRRLWVPPLLLHPANHRCWAGGNAPGSASTGQPVCVLTSSVENGDVYESERYLERGSTADSHFPGEEVLSKDRHLLSSDWKLLSGKAPAPKGGKLAVRGSIGPPRGQREPWGLDAALEMHPKVVLLAVNGR